MKKITILGSTGSIGQSSLKVIESDPGEYEVIALAGGRNVSLLLEQVRRFNPKAVALLNRELADTLKARLRGISDTQVFYGADGYSHLATLEGVDTVISAITGAAGLVPTYAAIRSGKDIALANKETMVMAGPIIMAEAKKQDVSILPVDSEHSAIFQCLQGHNREDLKRVILTASGGPFRELSSGEMESITPEAALDHPNWDMGNKITIDSATLMNKGLEAIEARWLFSLEMDQIHIVVHPESIIHSMVEYVDGSIIAQLGIPDMITPISYALSYPRHRKTVLPSLKIEDIGRLNFHKPDMERFRCLDLALGAIETGGSMPAVLNGANEIAVEAFLKRKIGFLQIPCLIERTMEKHSVFSVESIGGVLEADTWARNTAEQELIKLQ